MPVQVSRVIYLISIFNGTCNIYVTYYVTSRKDTFNRRFLGNWHARKSENSLESDCSNWTWQSSIHEYEYDLWSMAGCIRAYAKYPCVGIDPWNARYNVRCWFASDVFRCLRFFAQLSVFCVRLSRCIDVSSPAIYWYRHREIRLTRLRSLIFQASPPFSPIVHASIDHVVGGREEGEGGENSRRSSVTIRIFWAVFYTRTYIRFNIFLSSRAPSSPRVYRLTFPLRTVFLYFGIFFDFDAFTLFLAWTTSPCSRCICDIRVTTW